MCVLRVVVPLVPNGAGALFFKIKKYWLQFKMPFCVKQRLSLLSLITYRERLCDLSRLPVDAASRVVRLALVAGADDPVLVAWNVNEIPLHSFF